MSCRVGETDPRNCELPYKDFNARDRIPPNELLLGEVPEAPQTTQDFDISLDFPAELDKTTFRKTLHTLAA